MRRILFALVALSFSWTSCQKDKDLKEAIIVDTGDIAQGGCGYVVRLVEDQRELMPEYLPSAYRHDGYKVLVRYHTRDEQTVCEVHPINQVYQIIEIAEIRHNLD